MSQISTFTVNDGADTPVARTFNIADRDGSKTTYRTSDATLVRGQAVFAHETKIAKNAGAANRVLIGLTYPVEGQLNGNGNTSVLRSSLLKAEFNFAQDMTLVERKAAVGLLVNAILQADIEESIIQLTTLG